MIEYIIIIIVSSFNNVIIHKYLGLRILKDISHDVES